MFGLLPGGIQSDAIAKIWGESWKDHVSILLNRSLLKKSKTK